MFRLTLNEAMWAAQQAGFEGDDIPMIASIAKAESGLDPEVVGKLTDDNEDLGLCQISTKWHSAKIMAEGGHWRSPVVSMRLAKLVHDEFQRAGKDPWTAWSVYNSKAHEKHLPLARQQFQHGHLWPPTRLIHTREV